MQGSVKRALVAILVVVVAAIGVYINIGDAQSTLIALVGGVAAVLIAIGTSDGSRGSPAEPDAIAAPPVSLVVEVIEAIAEPVLIVARGRVEHANAGAQALLGGHIVDQDVRLAIRHPAASEKLSGPSTDTRPVSLVGLGALEQRWEMRVGAAAGERRVVHLSDRTGSYAAERMRVDFVANASHELRTPLASILGYVETLSDEAGSDPKVRGRFLKIMFDEAQRMQRLVEDLISLSRIEADKYRLPDRTIDIATLLDEVRGEFIDAGGPRSAELVADLELGIPAVTGDRAQLSQMLHNLIGNAMKYGRPGTPVGVRLWQDQSGTVRISVTDEGDGIAPEHLPRLTERFYRVDAGRSRAAGGTGLGLAIVKHIIERHRGRLDIVSEVGKGTTVTVVLPGPAATVIKP